MALERCPECGTLLQCLGLGATLWYTCEACGVRHFEVRLPHLCPRCGANLHEEGEE